ncbi:MAG: thermonuclease family protein [Pirellulaceae bacterium]
MVDGDTLIVRQASGDLANGEQLKTVEGRLRLLGIDCPESVKPNHPIEPWGLEASAFTRKFVARGPVHLRLDKRRQDRFGRFLAYVYVGDRMLNEELVRSGMARVSTFPGDSAPVTRKLRDAEREARAARRGIWSKGS